MATNPDDSAYPLCIQEPKGNPRIFRGLTKRELLASQILVGLISQNELVEDIDYLPGRAVGLADKLIKILNESPVKPYDE